MVLLRQQATDESQHKGSTQGEKSALRSGKKKEVRAVQRELRGKIMEGKNWRKMRDQLQQSSIGGVWEETFNRSGQPAEPLPRCVPEPHTISATVLNL